MAKKKKKKSETVKYLFTQRQTTIQDLIEEIKLQPVRHASKENIKIKKNNLKLIKASFKKQTNKINYLKKKMKKEINYFEKLRIAYEIEGIEKKLPDLSMQENEINKLSGKDFYYAVNTQFKTHKVWRSDIDKMKDNSFFIELMKKDVLDKIKKIERGDAPNKKQQIKILKNKLLPVLDFNLKIDSVRNEDIDSLDDELQEEIELASNPDIDQKEKGGRYPIEVILTSEIIELL